MRYHRGFENAQYKSQRYQLPIGSWLKKPRGFKSRIKTMHSKYSILLFLQPQDFKLIALNFVKAETMFVYSTSACVCELWPAY
jgi:hypothetical protein